MVPPLFMMSMEQFQQECYVPLPPCPSNWRMKMLWMFSRLQK
uniref:Alternative protein PTPRG n=1 Tax=Homo sapiens TaxID=9606 RepID=L8E7E6_HUMAN|nr:alternative protein PTPRG [Homo sapiens]